MVRVAQTIADLDGRERVRRSDVLLALSLRQRSAIGAADVGVSACDRCLRRGLTLELLAGHLETERARIDELLARPDEALVDAVGGRTRRRAARELARFDADAQRARIAAAGLDVVCRCSVDYPAELLGAARRRRPRCTSPARRRRLASLAASRPVAIVGARRASSYGIETARSLASALAGAGVTVVSGHGARGRRRRPRGRAGGGGQRGTASGAAGASRGAGPR